MLEARHERYQPVNELGAVPVGIPARRTAGVAGAEIDLRWRRLDFDLIPSARLEAMQDFVSRRDEVGTPIEGLSAVSRLSPVLRVALVKNVVDAQTLKAAVKANVGAMRAYRRSSSSTATGRRACSATTTSCPSAGRTPTSRSR